MEQLELLGIALKTLSESMMEYLAFERIIEDGNVNRQSLENAARLREVYFTKKTSDALLFEAIRSSMRADLLTMNQIIQEKIKVSEDNC